MFALLALISISGAVQVLLELIIAGLIFGILWWLFGVCAIPEPFNKVARVILAVLAAVVVIGLLLSIVGIHPVQFGP